MVTMKDIAMLAGISQQAVPSALSGNGNSRVSAEKKEKILKLARELNYVPNVSARGLSGSQTHTIGIIGAINGIWQIPLISEICEILIAKGYNTMISHYSVSNEYKTRTIVGIVSCGVDGVIIMNSSNKAEIINNLKVPSVFSSHNHMDGYDVGVDNELTGYIATKHLLEMGHRQVLFLSPMAQTSDIGKERLQGWRRAHTERGIDIGKNMIVALRDLDGRADLLIKLLKERHITAVFASNDYVGAKTMRSLFDHGVKVPDDIAVVGCNGQSFIEFCPVSLTTVLQPIRPQAELTVELLLKRIENHELHSDFADIRIKPQLWIGGSCGGEARQVNELFRMNTFESLEKDAKMNFNRNIILEE